MIDNKKLLATVIILSLVGVLSLFFLSTTIKPQELAISEIDEDHIGTLVKVNGTILKINTYSENVTTLKISDKDTNSFLTIFLTADILYSWADSDAALPGARLEATGVVELYNGRYEIVVGSPEDIVITIPASSNFVDVWQLLVSPDTFDEMTVRTNGTLHDIEIIPGGMIFELKAVSDEGTFYLSSIVFAETIEGAYLEGEEVEVVGTFGYYENMGRWQLEIDGEERIVPTVIEQGY